MSIASLRHGIVAIGLAALLLLALPSLGSAQSSHQSVLLAITRLNFDCYPDTVYGVLEVPSMHSYPTMIRWGRSSSRAQGGRSDGRGGGAVDSCADGVDPTRKVVQTTFLYPAWREFTSSVAFQEMNGDSLGDIVFYLHGKVEANRELRDTLRPVVLYGQYGLDTMRVIDLSTIPVFQSAPFFAAELSFGEDFINGEQRALTDSLSWELHRRRLTVRSRDTTQGDGRDTAGRQERGSPPIVAIHPNPSQEIASVQADQLPAGRWTVEVIGVNGAVYDRQEVVMNEPGNVLRTVDVRRLANGYYVLRVRSEQGIVGTYPIVVKR